MTVDGLVFAFALALAADSQTHNLEDTQKRRLGDRATWRPGQRHLHIK